VAEPGAWADWQHRAQAGVWNYYGDSGGSNTPGFVMDLNSEGMTDNARTKVVKDFMRTLEVEDDELVAGLVAVFMDPKVSLPSRWLMYYYS